MAEEIFITLLQTYGYLALYLIGIIEGPLITLTAGFLASLNYLNVFLVFVVAMLADITGDMIYYSAGFFGKNRVIRKLMRFFRISETRMIHLERFFKRHGGKSIFLAKLIQGMGMVILMSAGVARMRASKFLFYSVISSFFKSAFLVALGFFFGELYETIQIYLTRGGAIVVVLVLLVAIGFIIKKYLSYKSMKNGAMEEIFF